MIYLNWLKPQNSIAYNGRQYEKCRIKRTELLILNKVNMKTKTLILAVTKAFFILLVMCCFLSCQSKKERIYNMEFITFTVDSCEYIISKAPVGDYGWVMSHKGNCKYCAKRYLK